MYSCNNYALLKSASASLSLPKIRWVDGECLFPVHNLQTRLKLVKIAANFWSANYCAKEIRKKNNFLPSEIPLKVITGKPKINLIGRSDASVEKHWNSSNIGTLAKCHAKKNLFLLKAEQ